MSMAIVERLRLEALERLVAEQQRRIEALEVRLSAETASRSPNPLRQYNAARQADARRLDNVIASILAAHADAATLTAKELAKALARTGFDRVIPERTLRRHLTALRGHGHTVNGC